MSNESSQKPPPDIREGGAELSRSPAAHAPVPTEELPPEIIERTAQEVTDKVMLLLRQESFSGPIPPPKLLQEYDRIVPGAADRIIRDFESNSKHVRECEALALNAGIERDKVNHKSAERLVWAMLLLILVFTLTGHEKVASAIAVATVGAVITGFLHHRKQKKEEQDEEQPGDGA